MLEPWEFSHSVCIVCGKLFERRYDPELAFHFCSYFCLLKGADPVLYKARHTVAWFMWGSENYCVTQALKTYRNCRDQAIFEFSQPDGTRRNSPALEP